MKYRLECINNGVTFHLVFIFRLYISLLATLLGGYNTSGDVDDICKYALTIVMARKIRIMFATATTLGICIVMFQVYE